VQKVTQQKGIVQVIVQVQNSLGAQRCCAGAGVSTYVGVEVLLQGIDRADNCAGDCACAKWGGCKVQRRFLCRGGAAEQVQLHLQRRGSAEVVQRWW